MVFRQREPGLRRGLAVVNPQHGVRIHVFACRPVLFFKLRGEYLVKMYASRARPGAEPTLPAGHFLRQAIVSE